MKNSSGAYITLVISLVAQLFALKYFRVSPDLMVMITVFSGIFLGVFEGAALGLTAGFLRGCFSSGTIGPDMFALSVSAYAAAAFSSMFYRFNPLFHVVSVILASVFVLFAQATYLSSFYGVDVSFAGVLAEYRWQIFLTALFTPFMFRLWSSILGSEE
jgi:rod shape-determining protein MreD